MRQHNEEQQRKDTESISSPLRSSPLQKKKEEARGSLLCTLPSATSLLAAVLFGFASLAHGSVSDPFIFLARAPASADLRLGRLPTPLCVAETVCLRHLCFLPDYWSLVSSSTCSHSACRLALSLIAAFRSPTFPRAFLLRREWWFCVFPFRSLCCRRLHLRLFPSSWL